MELAVVLAGLPAGRLMGGARPRFIYDLGWERPEHTPLSLAMPVTRSEWDGRPLMHWLDGLLPDSPAVREDLGRRYRVSPTSALALLRPLGLDLPGAVQIVDPDQLEDVTAGIGDLVALDERAVGDRLRGLQRNSERWTTDGERWSLAGAQPKFALAHHGGTWFRAEGATPTTHIIKPGIVGLNNQALVEHITIQAGRRLGLVVAQTTYLEFDGQPAIVVTRYDRMVHASTVTRVHQEDLAQALSIPTMRKYESDGGPSAGRISDFLRSRVGGDANWRFAQALIFNYLVGAPDAHAKNYSLLLAGDNVRLAPLYDLATSLAYDADASSDLRTSAMTIGGVARFGEVGERQWRKLARRMSLPADLVLSEVRRVSGDLPDAVADSLATLPQSSPQLEMRSRLLPALVDHLSTGQEGRAQ